MCCVVYPARQQNTIVTQELRNRNLPTHTVNANISRKSNEQYSALEESEGGAGNSHANKKQAAMPETALKTNHLRRLRRQTNINCASKSSNTNRNDL